LGIGGDKFMRKIIEAKDSLINLAIELAVNYLKELSK
jgi:predicted phage-related endonuclease